MGSRLVRCALAVVLTLGFMPAFAWADDASGASPAPATESQVADLQAADTAGFVERETVASEKGYSDTTIDTSANSAAADFGFDTPFVDATEDDPVAADPLEGWVGTVPGELLMWTDDPDEWNGGDMSFHDIERHNARAARMSDSGWAQAPEYGASDRPNSVAIDTNGDYVDEIIVLGDNGMYYLSDPSGAVENCELSPSSNWMPLYDNGTNGNARFDESAQAPLFRDYNEHHLCAGDLDGNGIEDIVSFQYAERGPVVTIQYLYRIEDADIGDGWYVVSYSGGLDVFDAMSGYDTPTPLLAHEERVDLSLFYPDDYNGYLPASLEVADLNGDDIDEVYVAYQEGDPSDRGAVYRTNIAVIDTALSEDDTVDAHYYDDYRMPVEDHPVFSAPKPIPQTVCTPLASVGGNPSSQMTSLSAGDVDGDGFEELVVGGYAGANPLEGELYLAYMERGESGLDTTLRGLTWLLDDNGLHRTTGSNLTKHGHGSNVDTSLFEQDPTEMCFTGKSGNRYTLDRYVNTCNWTVPLSCVSLTGYQNGHTIDQVFFGMFFYDFNRDTGQFAPHLNTLDHAFSGNDDNNVLIVLSEATTPEDYVPTSTDDSAVLDMVESGGKEMLYQMAIFDESDGDARFDHYAYYDEGGKTDRVWTCDERNVDWDDKYRTFDGVIGNFQPIAGQDEDAFFMKLVGHEFTYSAPVIQAVVLAPPSFEDISTATGYDSGSTSLTRISGTTVDYSVSATVGFDFGIDFGVEVLKNETKFGITPGFSVAPAYKGSQAQEAQYTVTVSKGQDSVVLAAVPVDRYYYDVVRAGTGGAVDKAVVSAPGTPIVQTVPFDRYDETVDHYNASIDAYNRSWTEAHPDSAAALAANPDCAAFVVDGVVQMLPHLPYSSEIVSHEQGRPDTYHAPGGLDTSGFGYSDSTITLDYGNDFGSSTKSMLVTWKKTDGGGATLSQKGGFKFTEGTRFQDFAFTASYALSGSGNKSFTDGTTYKGDLKSVPTSWSDFGMTLSMYAGTFDTRALFGIGEYAVVGYEASNVRYGAAVPRGLSVTGTTPDTVTLECVLPWGAHNAANEYALERLNANTGAWETVHTFAKPNVTADSPEEFVETVTDVGLAPNTTYSYRLADTAHLHPIGAQAVTQKRTDAMYTVSFPECATVQVDAAGAAAESGLWGFVAASMIDGETGWKSSLTDGASVLQHADLRFFAIPMDGYEAAGWKVTETAPDGTVVDITDDRSRVVVAADGAALLVSDVQGDIAVEAYGRALGEGEEGPAVTVERLEGWGISVVDENGEVLHAGEALGVDGAFPAFEDARWTASGKPEVAVEAAAGTVASIDLYLIDAGESADGAPEPRVQKIVWTPGESDPMIGLEVTPDGSFLVVAVAHASHGTCDVRAALVRKDAQQPVVSLACVDGAGKDGSRAILAYPQVGASGLASIEIAAGKDVASGFVDVTGRFADLTRNGFLVDRLSERLENGWYTVRIANGAGATATASIEVTGVTNPAPFTCDGGSACPSAGFADVDHGQWYHEAIDWAVSNGVMAGFGAGELAGLFGPDMALTRAQMAQVLWNVEGAPAADCPAVFGDVSEGDWFYGPVAWAVSEGVFAGYGDGSGLFGPDDPLTREQAAAVLMRWAAANGESTSARTDLSDYPDADGVSGWARDYLSWAVATGIVSGVERPDGTCVLEAQGTTSRAMAAQLMMGLTA